MWSIMRGMEGSNSLPSLWPALRVGVFAALLSLASCGDHDEATGSAPFAVEATLGEVGLSPGQYSYPRCIDRDDSSLWIVDKTARVQRIDPATGDSLGGWRMPEFKQGKPTGVSVWVPREGPDELVFVPDTHYHRVMVYRVPKAPGPRVSVKSPEDVEVGRKIGTLVGEIGTFGEGPGQFIYPTDVAVFPSPDGKGIDHIYVTEYGGNDRLHIWKPTNNPFAEDSKYEFVRTIGTFGSSDSAGNVQFSRPQSISIDFDRRELVIVDACNHRVGRFTYEGDLVAWIGSVGQDPGQLSYPYGLSLLPDGSALVAEFGNNRVQRLDLITGKSLGTFGIVGRGPGQLATPWGVTMMGDLAYILDSGNNRIQVMRLPVRRTHAERFAPTDEGGNT